MVKGLWSQDLGSNPNSALTSTVTLNKLFLSLSLSLLPPTPIPLFRAWLAKLEWPDGGGGYLKVGRVVEIEEMYSVLNIGK